jgi:hypothetical protein
LFKQVIKDLRLLGVLLGESLSFLRFPSPAYQTRISQAVFRALMSAWKTVQRAAAFMFRKFLSFSNRVGRRTRLPNNPATPAGQSQQPQPNQQLQQPEQEQQHQQGGVVDKPDNKPRVVVFIDDLDRCKPNSIVEARQLHVLCGPDSCCVVRHTALNDARSG